MYNTLPFGPLSLPTGPIFALLAAFVALDVAGRTGRRFRLHPDDVWNTGLLALVAGVIVARLWTIIQFWPVYRAEPLLIVSLRPSGFAFWPGVIAAMIVGYAFMLRRQLDPSRILASLVVGITAGAILANISAWLTGTALGLPSDLPWATRHFLDLVHPVGLYRALGLGIVVAIAWASLQPDRPWRTIGITVLGYALVYLACDAFLSQPEVLFALRRSQVIALGVALVASLALGRETRHAPSAEAGIAQLPAGIESQMESQSEPTP